jgi:hypothetical protein
MARFSVRCSYTARRKRRSGDRSIRGYPGRSAFPVPSRDFSISWFLDSHARARYFPVSRHLRKYCARGPGFWRPRTLFPRLPPFGKILCARPRILALAHVICPSPAIWDEDVRGMWEQSKVTRWRGPGVAACEDALRRRRRASGSPSKAVRLGDPVVLRPTVIAAFLHVLIIAYLPCATISETDLCFSSERLFS